MDPGKEPLLDDTPERDESCFGSVPAAVRRRAAALVTGICIACLASLGCAGVFSAQYPVLLGHAFIAFTLGLRHAVDCDHLAAIDNVTRQLLNRGQWPVSVGFWFALGHSTVVIILTGVLAGGYSWAMEMTKEDSHVSQRVSLVAGMVSICLLGGIGFLNAQIACGLFQEWWELQKLQAHDQDEKIEAVAQSALRTALSAVPCIKRVFDHVDRPAKMFGVGFLFGLSFDSATQVGLIGLAAMTGTSGKVPPGMVMIFPIAFSCGMCLVDTVNGLLMLATYSWTKLRPIQKIFYNFVVTSMSAGIALIICSLEAVQILAQQLDLKGPFWDTIQNVDMATIGYTIIFTFAFVFGLAVCYGQGFCCRDAKEPHEGRYLHA